MVSHNSHSIVRLFAAVAISLLVTAAKAQSQPQAANHLVDSRFVLEVEGGAVWQARNDVQIPNDATGTRFSLADLAGSGPWLAGRLAVTWNINQRHGLRVLLAPFQYTETGAFVEPVDFAGERYLPAEPVSATYKFNSWRLTYRYAVYRGERWRWWLGVTAKIRDAKIALAQDATTSQDTDVGFVPLLHIAGACQLGERWHLLLDFDGLAGGPGRAFDVALKIGYDLSNQVRLTAGYRTLEGGVDIDDVYNFAWFNYAVVAVVWGFPCASGHE